MRKTYVKDCVVAGCFQQVEVTTAYGINRCGKHGGKTYKLNNTVKRKQRKKPKVDNLIYEQKVAVEGW